MLSYAKFAAACGILSLCVVGTSIRAEGKNPADQASERTPDANVQGKTSDKGPQAYGGDKKEEPKAESVGEQA